MDAIRWLEGWYAARCDGEWERLHGIELGTLDRPGWRLEVDLTGTGLEDRTFEPVRRPEKGGSWIECRTANGRFEGTCGVHDLEELLEIFRRWAERG